MSTLAEIENAIEKLPPQSFKELRKWIADRDWEQWDTQIENDVAAGRFDALRKRIHADEIAGLCKEL
jgi:hypothetical protein